MKRMGRIFGNLLAIALTVASLQAVAETQLGGRDFNHMSTGFPLSGGHATAACETCHAGGVFKGTPRNCEGCHALGRRIVATPKSNAHIVTNAPCESCHFRTSTWLGARYNHGSAVPGQCTTCHNGRISATKHASHILTTASCDQCHRSTTWVPASWNHTGAQYIAQDCGTLCHNGTTARTFTNTAWHGSYTTLGITTCKSCHSNYTSFYIERYLHNDAAYAAKVDCLGCHDGTHVGVRGIPANHTIALTNLINAPAQCNWCHSTTSVWVGMNHSRINAGTQCKACHLTGTSNFAGMTQKSYGHKSFNSGQDCISCHQTKYDYWNEP